MIGRHQERRGICPFCAQRGKPDDSGHLYQNTETLAFCCFRCGTKGKGEIKGACWLGAREIEVEAGLDAEHAKLGWWEPLTSEEWKRYVWKEITQSPRITAACEYLDQHHVQRAALLQYCVGVAVDKLVLPVISNNKVTFYQLRNLKNKRFRSYGPRFCTCPLFNLTAKPTGMIVVVESMVSALRLCPFVPTIALFGKLASGYQIEAIRKYGFRRNVVIWLDSDAVGDAFALAKELEEWCRIRCVIETQGEPKLDPCDLNDDEVRRVLGRLGV